MDLTITSLPLLDSDAGCGCGNCTCGAADDVSEQPATPGRSDAITATYSVTGMTCGHCERAVTNELKEIDGVSDVAVQLVAGGSSSVIVSSSQPLDVAEVAAALDEAGGYRLV
jgi:copper chaperone